jgi:hypothetical protein
LVTWTILVVTLTILAVIDRCFVPYALLGLHSLPGVRLVIWNILCAPYCLSSIEPCFACKITWWVESANP